MPREHACSATARFLVQILSSSITQLNPRQLFSIFACDARMVQRPQNELRMGQGIIVYLKSGKTASTHVFYNKIPVCWPISPTAY